MKEIIEKLVETQEKMADSMKVQSDQLKEIAKLVFQQQLLINDLDNEIIALKKRIGNP